MALEKPKNNNQLQSERMDKPEEAKELDVKKQGIKLFFGEKERQLLDNMGREIVNDILLESFLLYRIDYRTTKTHRVYGEAKQKNYETPVEVFGRISVETDSPSYFAPGGLIREGLGKFTAHVYLSHLEELDVTMRMGDFVYHKGNYYEIIDNGAADISNKFAFGSDKYFYITIKGVEVNTDVFQAR
jgi:hypothetical protein